MFTGFLAEVNSAVKNPMKLYASNDVSSTQNQPILSTLPIYFADSGLLSAITQNTFTLEFSIMDLLLSDS